MTALIPCVLLALTYGGTRDAIMNQTAPLLGLTPAEQTADSILEELKQEALAMQDPHDPWVGTFFPLVMDEYRGTRLFTFLGRMPKGAVLHVHPSAMGDYRNLFDYVLANHGGECCFSPSQSAFCVFTGSVPDGDWVQVTDMLAASEDSAALRDSLFDLIVIDAGEAHTPDLWYGFEEIFGRVAGLFATRDIVDHYYLDALRLYAEEGVQHIELRAHRPSPGAVDCFLSLADSLEAGGDTISLRIVYCDTRYLLPGETVEDFDSRIVASMEAAADLMHLYPGIVVGGDVYSQEDRGATAFYMAPLLEEARIYSMETYGFELPLYLHDGESSFPTGVPDSPVSLIGPYPGDVNNNVIDAYILGAERVGHGIELAKLPGLAELYAEEGIPLEICPISNQLLGYTPDLREHPAVTLMREGVRISINPDDPAIFQSGGVTCDWVAAVLAWDLTLADVKRLILYSIEDAAMTDEEKLDLLRRWQAEWDGFIGSCVSADR